MGTRAGSRTRLADYVSSEGLAQLTAAADGSHMSGAMIALMPTLDDAARLAIEGGEAAEQLHCTLFYLGKGADFSEAARRSVVDAVTGVLPHYTDRPVSAKAFGAAHWNGNSDEPCWVWSVGDDPETPRVLGMLHGAVAMALEEGLADVDHPELPEQHTPWAPHICAAYSDQLDLVIALEERLGPIVFDRVRVAFAGDHTDISLGEPVTAAAGPLRRQPTDLETRARTDFAAMDQAWHQAVDDTIAAWADIQQVQREEITAAVQAAAEADNLAALDDLTVDTDPAAALLTARMIRYAREAGEAQQAEAEAQGVDVPEWSLDDEAVVAAAFRDRIRQVARTTARLTGANLVASGVRRAMRLFGSGSPDQVAAQVDEHLADLSDAPVREAIGGAMSAAQNEGRMAVLQAAPTARYIASEILDKNGCPDCRKVDGTVYESLPDARKAYPSGGYVDCEGGSRCRGTLVAVWDAAAGDETAAGTILALAAATIPPTTNQQGGAVLRTVQDHPDCGADAPWAVQDEEGELKGCYATQAEADAACAELDDDQGDDEKPNDDGMDYGGQTARWEGPLAVEGIVTGDGREFAEGALTWADLPIPLRWNKEDSHGGEPRTIAVNVGRIDRIWRDGSKVMGAGVLDLSDEDGRRVHAKIEGKFLRGVSIDADSIADADTEFVWPDDVNAGTGDSDDQGDEPDMFEMLFAQPEKVIFHGGRIRAATLVDIPAFAEAYIALLDEAGAIVAGGQPVTAAELRELWGTEGEDREPLRAVPPVTASAEAWRPPAAWFADPGLSLPTPITVTDDGRIYGHAAQWGACHIGQDDVCVQPPHEEQHPYYRTGEVVCADGSRVAVGQITVGTGHAPLHLGASPAAEHYDNTGAAVADVAVGNDANGIWVAGAVRPGADPLKVYELQAAGQVSGDWRRIGGQLRLVGLLAVNVPGFPVPKMRARVASGEPQALLAAGRPTVAWGRSQSDLERDAVRIVMRMLSRRVHPGGR